MASNSWIDFHAHLADTDEEKLNQHLKNCSNSNVSAIIDSATNIETSKKIAQQMENHNILWGTAGISPFDTENADKNWEKDLLNLLSNKQFIAVGEIGMDNTNPTYPPIDIQKHFFLKQLEIAKKTDRPVIVHSRGSEVEVLNHLKSNSIKKAIFHCYTGPKELIPAIIDSGYFISYSGIATFKKEPLNEQIEMTPLSKIFIETDSPYLAPHPFRGKTNEPAFVSIVGEKVASLKNTNIENLQSQIIKNFEALFQISPFRT